MQSLRPKNLSELCDGLSVMTPRSKLIAGGTDYIIAERSGKFDPDILLYPGEIEQLHRIELTDQVLRIGAMVTMAELAETLNGCRDLQAFSDAAARVGSPQIRNKATVVGNLCNASPAGDMLPVSWLFSAELEVLCADGKILNIPVERFLLGPQKTMLSHNQMVLALCVDRRCWTGSISAFRKIGSREFVSISRESIAAAVRFSDDGVIEKAVVTLGSVFNTPIFVPEATEIILGNTLTDDLIEQLIPVIAKSVHDHCRPTNRHYKTEAARGLTLDLFALIKQRI